LFTTRREHVVALAAKYRIPAIYAFREFPADGGLMSYSGIPDSYRQAGVYTGRILKGEKPADLPVVQASPELSPSTLDARTLLLKVGAALLEAPPNLSEFSKRH
jgi:putative tryptophan/tyrosine transport system substrate-binding protein